MRSLLATATPLCNIPSHHSPRWYMTSSSSTPTSTSSPAQHEYIPPTQLYGDEASNEITNPGMSVPSLFFFLVVSSYLSPPLLICTPPLLFISLSPPMHQTNLRTGGLHMQIGFKEDTPISGPAAAQQALLMAAYHGNHSAVQDWIGMSFLSYCSLFFVSFLYILYFIMGLE